MTTITSSALQELEERFPARDLPAGTEVVRVAPSPTGKPHLGTGLQSTIDYALARKTGGVFILRIEDTDRTRLVPGSVEEIMGALDWLGLHPGEGPVIGGSYGPYVESERLPIYHTVADVLVEEGSAYPCFCTPQRLEALREQQRAASQPTGYDRHCRYLTPEERQQHLDAGEKPVTRLAMPTEGAIVVEDAVRGRIEFRAAEQDDQVLVKSDGFPTYHLAAIVDDHFMRVTTVVRGEEWVSSTPKHVVLMRALGWHVPVIVHTPLLRDEQGRKLGKRTGDTSLTWFRGQGYPPEALRNFLIRIIWPHPEGKDVYPYEDFIERIVPSALPNTGPVVNLALLDHISGEWIRDFGAPNLYSRIVDWLDWVLGHMDESISFDMPQKSGRVPHSVSREELIAFQRAFTGDREYSERILSLEPERYHSYASVVLQNRFYYRDLFTPPTREALVKAAKGDAEMAPRILGEYLARLSSELPLEAWEERVRALAAELGVKHGVIFMLLRVAITGTDRTPPLHPIMGLLGHDEVERRLHEAQHILAA